MSSGTALFAVAKGVRTTLSPLLETLQREERTAPRASRALEHVASAMSALYAAEAEALGESSALAELGIALDELSLALAALREAVPETAEIERAERGIAGAVARLFAVAGGEQRKRREAVLSDSAPNSGSPVLVRRPSGSLPAGVEQRAGERVPVSADVGLLSDSNFFTGLSEDISTGGVFIATTEPLAVGTAVTVFFTLEGIGPLELEGFVRWVRGEESERVPGMGIAFAGLTDALRRVIQDYCASRPPLFAQD